MISVLVNNEAWKNRSKFKYTPNTASSLWLKSTSNFVISYNKTIYLAFRKTVHTICAIQTCYSEHLPLHTKSRRFFFFVEGKPKILNNVFKKKKSIKTWQKHNSSEFSTSNKTISREINIEKLNENKAQNVITSMNYISSKIEAWCRFFPKKNCLLFCSQIFGH